MGALSGYSMKVAQKVKVTFLSAVTIIWPFQLKFKLISKS